MRVFAVDKPEIPPLEMPDRFKHDIAYFMTPPGERGAPELPTGDYWIHLDDARTWLADGVLRVISPLDSQNQAEIEFTAEQEVWLEWLVEHNIQHVRLAP